MLEISDLISSPSKSQDYALPPHIKYPAVLGLDVAGTVVQLGSNVTRFNIEQKVIGYVTSYFE